MANLYGVANAPGIPINIAIGAPVALPANVETVVFDSGPIIAPSQGYFYPIIWVNLNFQHGATPPSSIIVAGRIGAGADFFQYGVNGSTIIASQVQQLFTTLIGPASQIPWQGVGSHIQLTCLAQTNPDQVSNFGSDAWFTIYRAPDQ